MTGFEPPAFRALSLLSAAGALLLVHTVVRRVASPPAAALAAVLVAAGAPFWAVATTGRFYAPFLVMCLGVLFVLTACPRPHRPPVCSPGALAALFVLAFLSRLTHELASCVPGSRIPSTCSGISPALTP